ncbi:hypothetical protein [Streptomyces pini]|uniref:Uncharacterized protein n=1 Tax=Streptomyces pini TaxID=1520580 RepID=A0A1I4C1B9_9ACTN|nr:hypothetical protein [Streptomyces pini]SFK73986.1 hypothetical protein SAMN05192584_108193 [Streptomyces pini]
MTTTTVTAPAAVWPEGVIARYLTVAGATVDLTYTDEEAPGIPVHQGKAWAATKLMVTITVTARCTGEGCRAETTERGDTEAPWGGRPLETGPGITVTRWAQSHAERCRAIPRPTA